MVPNRFVLATALAVAVTFFGNWDRLLSADDDARKAKWVPSDGADEKKADSLQVPDGDVRELIAFIKEIQSRPPRTAQESNEYQQKAIPAMKAAAERIQRIATEEDRQLPGFVETFEYWLTLRAGDIGRAPLQDQRKLLDEIKQYLMTSKTSTSKAGGVARQLTTSLEYGSRPELAIDAYRELGAILSASGDKSLREDGAKMKGAVRRLTLLGNPLELSGTVIDGTKIDWAKYRGKVVLVDFWATWCGPCIAELPNVKKNYEAYHDKGFDVVGVSLDQDRAALEAFLAKEQNPWTTIHDGDWSDNAVATYYGIVGIPTVILVDQTGTVVSTKARGEELSKLLAKLLGPSDTASKAEDAKAKN